MILVVGRRKLTPGVLVYGTNSVAIATTCHYDGGKELGLSNKALPWGVTEAVEYAASGHCCVPDEKVEKPVEGMLYM